MFINPDWRIIQKLLLKINGNHCIYVNIIFFSRIASPAVKLFEGGELI